MAVEHTDPTPQKFPKCYGHRGASAAWPENTMASFEAAIRDGAEGLESDLHITTDNVVVLHHDPSIERCTDGTGMIASQPWHGVLEHVRTKAEPKQPMPTLDQMFELLMREENRHVEFNERKDHFLISKVDVKPENDPERMFRIIRDKLAKYPTAPTELSPRIVLGLWHPRCIEPAKRYLPNIHFSHIGFGTAIAREFFWKDCQTFSIFFGSLVGAEGELFRKDVKAAGKELMVWTVNNHNEMVEAAKWGCRAVITDVPSSYLALRRTMQTDWQAVAAQNTGWFPWSSWKYYNLPLYTFSWMTWNRLEKRGGPLRPPYHYPTPIDRA